MRIHKNPLFLSTLVMLCAHCVQAAQWDMPVDDSDSNPPLKSWAFSNGSEFPGASGDLTPSQGHDGHKGARLSYSMSCDAANHCGHYVAAYWNAPKPVPVPANGGVSFWVNTDLDTDVVVRFFDDAGQTFQHQVSLVSLENQKLEGWHQVNVPFFSNAQGHWGGKNDGVFSGRIVRFGILAQPKAPGTAQGELTFSDVRFQTIAGSSMINDPSALAVIPGSAPELPLARILGVNIHFTDNPALLALASDAGFSFVRMDLNWAAVEKTPGQYNFSAYDTLLKEAEAQKLGILWIFDYGNSLYGGYPLTDAGIAAYARYAQAAAAHFKGHNVTFEIWNEPEGKSWHIPVDTFVRVVHATSQAIRNVWPQAVVVSGGTSGGVNAQMTYSSALAKSGSAIDAIAIHPYRQSAPETMIGDVNMIRRVIPASTVLWDSEWGYPSAGYFSAAIYGDGHSATARHRQAVLAVRELLSAWLARFPQVVWYDLIDDGVKPDYNEHNFGLLDHDGKPKPAYVAVQYLTMAAEGRYSAGLLSGLPQGLHALRLDGVSGSLLIVWYDTEAARYDISIPARLMRVTDMYGRDITVASTQAIAVRENSGPVYVYFEKALALKE